MKVTSMRNTDTNYAQTRRYLKSRAVGLQKMGMPLSEIANHVERSPLTILRWLKEGTK